MQQFAHDTIVPLQHSPLSKKEQVAGMFDSISLRYDFLNRFLSAGIDQVWRKKALQILKKDQPQTMLDVATGTGDLAIMAEKMLSPKSITGIDISEGMLAFGRKKILEKGLEKTIQLQGGDSEAIGFEDNHFDAVTVAFGVRNFENLTRGLQEMLRVLKPGGRLVILEFSKPKTPVVKQFYSVYMEHLSPFFGKMFSKNKEAYQYLNNSIKNFPEGKNFTQILSTNGYQNVTLKPLSFGVCTIYSATK